ncbi:MAG TPA: PIG-L family deacetylase [Candidatus Limnocylindrales bacterium]
MSLPMTLMTVNGHPDDETVGTGGVMARYAAEGIRVVCVLATRGEAGRIAVRELDTPENRARLGEIRECEVRRALARLGVSEVEFLGYRDSGMMGTAANKDPRSLWQADRDDAIGRLVAIVRSVRPDVIVAPNAYGGDGHPDHIRASELARGAFERAGDPSAYPDEGDGHGLEPWAPRKLYEVVDQLGRRAKIRRALATGGLRSLVSIALRVARHWTPNRERKRARARAAQGTVTTRVNVSAFSAARHAAMAEHRTQMTPGSERFVLTADERKRVTPTEDFTLRSSRVEAVIPEDDLFAGLR